MGIIKFKPLFIIYVFLCVYFGWYNDIFYYILAVVLHEYGHYFVAKFLGYNVGGMVFDLYGAGIKIDNYFSKKHDIVISLAGPFVNLLMILIIVCCWWLFPQVYMTTYNFFVCNLMVMFFNLLPIYPLDFGRVIIALGGARKSRKKVLKINSIICLIMGSVLEIVFIISLFYNINLNMLFVGLFLIVNGIMGIKNMDYNYIKKLTQKKINDNEVKLWKVDSFDKIKLIKLISREYYSIFVMFKNGEKLIMVEDELFN